MSEPSSIFEWLGLSGVIAGIGAAVGYGRLGEKVEAHQKELADFREIAKRAGENNQLLVRLDERVVNLRDEIAEIKQTLKDHG